MKKATIIYGSTTGNTETAAEIIKKHLPYETQISNVKDATPEMIKNSELVIFGSSTWGYGELQDDFQEFYDKEMTSELLQDKKVAVFGCGDQAGFTDVFCEAVNIINEKAKECGADVVSPGLKIDADPSDSANAIISFAENL